MHGKPAFGWNMGQQAYKIVPLRTDIYNDPFAASDLPIMGCLQIHLSLAKSNLNQNLESRFRHA
jgi:hypothetical protein